MHMHFKAIVNDAFYNLILFAANCMHTKVHAFNLFNFFISVLNLKDYMQSFIDVEVFAWKMHV